MRRNHYLNKTIAAAALGAMALFGGPLASDALAHSGSKASSGKYRRYRSSSPAPRLSKRLREVRRDVEIAAGRLSGFDDWRARSELREARQRLSNTYWHLRNESFLAARRSLDRADKLARSIMAKASELRAYSRKVKAALAEFDRRAPGVHRLVDRSSSNVASGNLHRARRQYRNARAEMNRGDWRDARSAIDRALSSLEDASRQARAELGRATGYRFRRALDRADHVMQEARHAVNTRGCDRSRARLRKAEAERKQAIRESRRGEYGTAVEHAGDAERAAQAAIGIANGRQESRWRNHGRRSRGRLTVATAW